MRVSISDIKVRKRIRKENGDIEGLMESLRTHGLLNPIVISEKYELIAGFRRFTAAKNLGWETIPATMVDARQKLKRLEMEMEENIQRLDFSEEEIYEGIAVLERYKNPKGFLKIWIMVTNFFVWFFDKQEARKSEKRKKNAKLSCLLPIGISLGVVSGILYKQSFIGSVLLNFLNIISIGLFVVGLLFFIRFLRGRGQS